MKDLKPFRVITGSRFDAKTRSMLPTAFHMTFYAADRETLDFLMVSSWCPSGVIYSAGDVETKELAPFVGPHPIFSPN